jgi:hypothetical protein
MSDSPYLSRIEWEPCTEAVTLAVSDPIEGLPPGPESITIRRDDQYRLVADLGGMTSAEAYGAYHQTLRETVPGTIRADGVDVAARHLSGSARVHLSVGGSANVSPLDKERFTWTATRHAYRLRQDHSNSSPPAWHTDWFLNGPRHGVLDRATEHSAKTSYVRDRGGDRRLDLTELSGESGQFDHIVVAAGDLTFIVHLVPDEFGPKWSKNLGIEYAWKGGAIPDENTREAIGEIIGFVTGRRLMPVGSTTFDAAGYPIVTDARSPWGDENQSNCTRPDDPPFDIQVAVEGSKRLEEVLADLVPKYLAARDTFAMKDALWSYWLAKEAPLGLDLPISAVESLKTAWFRSNKTKLKGIYLEKAKFDNLLVEAFRIARESIKDEPFRDRIMRRLQGCFQMGSNEQLDTFFSELGLTIGAQERAAIRARNAPAHGGGAVEEEQLTALHRHGITYRVLFERVFLKILGYEGRYIDRATLGFPLRILEEPVGDEGTPPA